MDELRKGVSDKRNMVNTDVECATVWGDRVTTVSQGLLECRAHTNGKLL